MKLPVLAAGLSAIGVLLHGCGSSEGDATSMPTTTSPATNPHSETTSTASAVTTSSTTTLPQATNIWQWRSDMEMGTQITYDLSGDTQKHCLYGGCWREYDPQTLAGGQFEQYGPVDQQFVEDGKTYGTYDGKTGVTLFNKRNRSHQPGCLMRKSRVPIDLSVITRIEMDVHASGSTSRAPWYAVWLAPAIYADEDDNAKAAEIDLIENYESSRRGSDMNDVQSAFAQCGTLDYTMGWCQRSGWGGVATKVSHHITLDTTKTDEGRVIRVHRCGQDMTSPMDSCPEGEYAEIKVTKRPPANVGREEWFRVWNKDVAKDRYAKYWLVIDLWWTSDTDFKLQAENVRFFKEDGSEWEIPFDDPAPSFNLGSESLV